MLNKYPMWKNLLVLLIVLLGFIYAIPNLYPDDEAIQVNNEFGLITDADLERATTALEAAQLNFFGANIDENGLLLRFSSVEEQLRGKTALENAFGQNLSLIHI